MDEEEKDTIISNLSDLILHTSCNADLLTFFQQNKIISLADIENIAAKRGGTSRAKEFFKIIQKRPNAFPILLKGLKKYKQFEALQILTGNKEKVELSEKELRSRIKRLFRDEKLKSGISFDVAPPVHLFTGRSKELLELHEMVQKSKEGSRITVISQLTTVSGLGGIGKTQLARQYIQERREEFDDNIIWLNAESQSKLSDSFRILAAQKLNLPTTDAEGKEKSGKAVAEDVYKYFEGSRALFVLDNADNSGIGPATPLSSSWLYHFLPNPQRNPDLYTIITSRNTEWGIGMKIIRLDVFSIDEAIAMIKFGLEINEEDMLEDDYIINLAEALQCFPLALHQAISFIYEQRQISKEYSIETYISEFESTKQEMMLSYREADSLDDTYMLTTMTTWKITVDKIRAHPEFGDMSIFFLQVMSYYNPTNIWRDTFYFVASLSVSDVKFIKVEFINSCIRLLVKYSMISCLNKHQSILSVHRLVQAVTRIQTMAVPMTLNEWKGDYAPFIAAIHCLKDYCQDDGKTFHVKNIEHGIAVWRHCWKHPLGILPVRALFLLVLGKMLECGRLDEGIDLCSEALTKYYQVFNDENQFCFEVKTFQRAMLHRKGNREEVLSLERLDEAKRVFGEESGEFQSMEFCISSEKGAKDLNSLVKDFNSIKATLGENDEFTLEAQNALARHQMENGLDSNALETFEDLIIKYKTAYVAGHANYAKTLTAEANVAKIYFKSGKKEEALQLFQNLHEKFLQFPDKYSHQLALFCLDYAKVLGKADRFQEAVNVLENCNERLMEVYGEQHFWKSLLVVCIGSFQMALGKFKNALDTHSEALQSGKAMALENSSEYLKYKQAIAFDLICLGKIKESMALLKEVLNQCGTGIFDKDLIPFVSMLRKHGNDLEALELAIAIKNFQKCGLAEENAEMETISQEISTIRKKLQIKKEIKIVSRAALQGDISFERAFSVLSDYSKLMDFYDDNIELFFLNILFIFRFSSIESLKQNLKGLQHSYDEMKKCTLINQKIALDTLIALGDVHFAMKNYEQAFEYHTAAFAKFSELYGDLYVTTIATKIRMAADLFCKGNPDESLLMFEEIHQILKKLEADNPNENDLTLNVLNYAVETLTILFKGDNPRTKQILEYIEKMRESLEPKVFIDQLNCADDFITRGDYVKSYKMYKDVYQKGDSPIWRADMCEVASACKNLAHVLNQLDKHEEALEIVEGNLELAKVNLGREHHWTYLLQGCLANAHRGLGNYKEALKLHNETYQGLLITIDEDHEDMLILKKEIAVDLSLLGRHEESICAFLDVLDKLEAISGNKSYEVILAKIEFGEAIERQNESLQDALEILEKLNEVMTMTELFDKESLLFRRVAESLSKIKNNLIKCA